MQSSFNTVFVVESASTGMHRRHTVAPAFLTEFTGCYRAKPYFDRQESGHRRLCSVTHRGRTGSRRFYYGFTMWSYGGDIRIMPEDIRRCPGISRPCFAPRCVPVSPCCFKKLKPLWPLPGDRRFMIQCGACRRC